MEALKISFRCAQGLKTVRYLTGQKPPLRGEAGKSSIKWKDGCAFLFLPPLNVQRLGHFGFVGVEYVGFPPFGQFKFPVGFKFIGSSGLR